MIDPRPSPLFRPPAPRPFPRRSLLPGEHACTGYWLLRRDDPTVFFGCDCGWAFTGTVLPGGDFDESLFKKPARIGRDMGLRYRPFAPTRTLRMRRDGAMVASARPKPGNASLIYEIADPTSGRTCVAGWNRGLRRWEVE